MNPIRSGLALVRQAGGGEGGGGGGSEAQMSKIMVTITRLK